MKKLAIIIISIICAANFGVQAQTGKVRYLQAEAPGKTTRIITDGKTPYTVKTEMDENNQLVVVVYKGEELVATYPEGTKFYPKYDDPEDISVQGLTQISENERFEMASNVIFAKNDMNSKIVSFDEDGNLFANQSDVIDNIKIGDVLYSLPTENFPNGYALKITAINNIQQSPDSELRSASYGVGDVQFVTTPATINEVFQYFKEDVDYKVITDVNQCLVYDIDVQLQNPILPQYPINGAGSYILPPATEYSVNHNIDLALPKVTWSPANPGRLKKITIDTDKTTLEYIIFDADGDIHKTTDDQIILELTATYDLSNTHIHGGDPDQLKALNWTIGVNAIHTWGFSAALKYAPKANLDKQTKKLWEDKLKEKMLDKRLLITRIPLAGVLPTSLVITPYFDIYFTLSLDVNGEFKVTGGVENVTYNYNMLVSPNLPKLSYSNFKLVKKENINWYFKPEISAKCEAGLGLGMGVTFEMPAFRALGGTAYIGFYGEYGIKGTLKASLTGSYETGSDQEATDCCFKADFSTKLEPSLYAEYKFELSDFEKSRKVDILDNILLDGKSLSTDIESLSNTFYWCVQSPAITEDATDVAATSATLNGKIDKDYAAEKDWEIYERGFYYSTQPDVITEGSDTHKITNTSEQTTFNNAVNNLKQGTTYYYTAYVVYASGERYGKIKEFRTTTGDNPTAGLVAYYPFNGNANDESGNGNHGTVNGATLTTDRKGRVNSAYSFNGTNNYIQIPFNRSLLPDSDEKSYTFWLKTTDKKDNVFMFQNGEADYTGGQFRIQIESSGWVWSFLHSYWGYNGGTRADYMRTQIPNFNPDQYHFVVVIVNKQNVCYYVDGNKISEKEWTLPYKPFDSEFQIEIGRYYNSHDGGFAKYFNGALDEIRIYNHALSDSEIQALYNE